MKTLKFWTYNRGWVLLTIKEGQTLDWTNFAHHDEGWSRVGLSVYYSNLGFVRIINWSEGTDCDGRHYGEQSSVCDAAKIREIGHADWTAEVYDYHRNGCIPGSVPNFKPVTPPWEAEDSHQRDYFAEAAGY